MNPEACMDRKSSNIILIGIFLAIILGGISGWVFGEQMQSVAWLGTLFLNGLKMIIIPLVICSMIVGITSLGDIRRIGGTGLKTILYYSLTTAISVLIGIVMVNIIQPGAGIETAGAEIIDRVRGKEDFTFLQVILGLVPPNLFKAMAEMQILPLIFFSLLFGGVLTTLGKKAEVVITFFEVINDAIMKIVHLILWFAPIGIFGLVAGKLGSIGGGDAFQTELIKLGKYALTVIIGLSIHAFIVLPLFLRFMGKKNPLRYAYNMASALTTAFSTASSSATLPLTMECVEEKNEIPPRAASFVLPLGATINMDGTALYEAVAAMFIAQAYGIDLSAGEQVIVFLTATLAAIGAAGIPEAGLVMMVVVLQAVNLPLEGIGMLLTIDWFLDRCRTTVNVWGDSVGAAVIAQTKEIKQTSEHQSL